MFLLVRVFLPFSFGYFLSFLYRNVNAVIYRELVADLGLQAAALGLLTSAYFLSFAAVQLPLGLALDRFGPRRVDAALLVVAGIGALAFSFGQDVPQLVVGRALIGLGVSGCLMSSMKAFSQWYPPERFAGLNGWLFAIGGLGAMSATAPVEAALHLTDWRGVFQALSALTFLVAGLIFVTVPERRLDGGAEPAGELIAGLKQVLIDPTFWRLGFVNMTQLGAAGALQSLWIAPWLRDVARRDAWQVADALFGVMVALTLGFLVFGTAVARVARFGWTPLGLYMAGSVLGSVSLAALVWQSFVGSADALVSALLWMALSFFTAAGTLGFPILAHRFPPRFAGRAATSLNMVSFIAAFLTQVGVGPVLDRWPVTDGRYTPAAYGYAFAVVLGLQVVALWLLWRGMRRRDPPTA